MNEEGPRLLVISDELDLKIKDPPLKMFHRKRRIAKKYLKLFKKWQSMQVLTCKAPLTLEQRQDIRKAWEEYHKGNMFDPVGTIMRA